MELALIGFLYLAVIALVSTTILFFTAKIFKRPISFAFALLITIILLLLSVGVEVLALVVDPETFGAALFALGVLIGAVVFVYALRKKYSYSSGGNIGLFLVSQVFAGIAAAIITIFFSFIILNNYMQSYEVFGRSMAPTLEPGDQLALKKNIDDVNDIEHGDIVSFKHGSGDNETQLIKRVVGLPGDRVVLEDGNLSVHLAESNEIYRPYEDQTVAGDDSETVVESDSLYLVGDNLEPGASMDSRNVLGLVPFDDVVGVYWFSY